MEAAVKAEAEADKEEVSACLSDSNDTQGGANPAAVLDNATSSGHVAPPQVRPCAPAAALHHTSA